MVCQIQKVGRAYADHPGILRGDDMTTETLVAKTMWALGQSRDAAEIQRLFYSQVNHDRIPMAQLKQNPPLWALQGT